MAATVATPLERSLGRIAGVTEMTSSQLARLDAHHAAVRPRSRDIDGAARDVQAAINAARSAAADRPAEQPDLPQGQPGRRADHDPGADLGHDDAGPDVRRGVDDPRAEALAGRRASGQVTRRRQLAAGGARRAQSARRSTSTASALEDVRTALAAANANRPKGSVEDGDRALADLRQRPGEDGGRVPAADRRLPQRRRGAAAPTSPRSSTRCRTCATPASAERQAVGAASSSTASPTPTSSRRSTASRALLPSLRASIPSAIDLDVGDGAHADDPRARCATSSARWSIAVVLVILVVFLFLRNVRARR